MLIAIIIISILIGFAIAIIENLNRIRQSVHLRKIKKNLDIEGKSMMSEIDEIEKKQIHLQKKLDSVIFELERIDTLKNFNPLKRSEKEVSEAYFFPKKPIADQIKWGNIIEHDDWIQGSFRMKTHLKRNIDRYYVNTIILKYAEALMIQSKEIPGQNYYNEFYSYPSTSNVRSFIPTKF